MIISIFKQNIYLYLLILTTIEGPITSFVSAWFAAQWVLRIEYVAIIAFLWDIIWDIFLYMIWRLFGKISFLKKFQLFSKEQSFLKRTLDKSPFLYLLVVKFTPYLSTPSLIYAWSKKMKVRLFVIYSFVISIFVKIIYLTLGYMGSFSVKQVRHFIDWWKQIVLYVLIWVWLFVITKWVYSYLWKRIKKDVEDEIKKDD